MFEFRNQPLKALYLTYFISSTLLIRLPFWLITAIPPFLRPRRQWPFARAIILPGIRAYVATWYATSFPPPPGVGSDAEAIASEPETAKALGFAWVAPLPDHLITSEIREFMNKQDVKAERTVGYWYQRDGVEGDRDRKAGPDEKVLLHFYGGGYVSGSAHPKGGAIGPVAEGLLAHVHGITRLFAGGYRLSSSKPFPPANPFPAALLDALACYYYLVDTVKFTPENIIVSGDSAGGHLALSLARYIARQGPAEAEEKEQLPKPGALLLLSPTAEWAVTHTGKDASMKRNARSDYCGDFFRGYTQRSFLGPLPVSYSLTSAWISPASLQLPKEELDGLFKGIPKNIYFLAGEAEICLDSYRTLRDRLVKDVGKDDLRYNEVPDSAHDFITMSWHEPERTNALKDIAEWVDTL